MILDGLAVILTFAAAVLYLVPVVVKLAPSERVDDDGFTDAAFSVDGVDVGRMVRLQSRCGAAAAGCAIVAAILQGIRFLADMPAV